jgi:hypothetical protein
MDLGRFIAAVVPAAGRQRNQGGGAWQKPRRVRSNHWLLGAERAAVALVSEQQREGIE